MLQIIEQENAKGLIPHIEYVINKDGVHSRVTIHKDFNFVIDNEETQDGHLERFLSISVWDGSVTKEDLEQLFSLSLTEIENKYAKSYRIGNAKDPKVTGAIGGKRSLETMSPQARIDRAKKAVQAREAKRTK